MSNAIALDPSQERAVELMLSARVGIVTGGPGRGKTTITRVALDRMDARGERYELASPTGKAARRLEEATERPAQTIHRLLGYGQGDPWAFNIDNPLPTDAVIIDECSMVCVEVARALFESVQPPTRLILVGDDAQLPSVGPGRVFADLIESHTIPVARLTKLHRSAAQSWVATQAPEVLAGRVPSLDRRDDFEFIERENRDAAAEALVELVTRTLPERGIAPADVQVLIPMTVGPAGTSILNRRLQALCNTSSARGSGWKIGGGDGEGAEEIRVGDRVIQTRNNYLLGVFNGETGRVLSCSSGESSDGAELVVDFGDAKKPRLITYDRDSARALRLAYALTVHRYQGSESPWIVALVHSTHTRMLSRNLLYTAITRAKKGVVIVGDRIGIERAVKNARDAKRNTGLADRLREGAGQEGSEAA